MSDEPPEHARWRDFLAYVDLHRPLSAREAERLYDRAGDDPDGALDSGERSLVKIARRIRLLNELEGGLTDDLFTRCMAAGDAILQRALLDR